MARAKSTGSESLSPLEAGLRSVYACLAARTSGAEGRFVDVAQLGSLSAPRSNGNGRLNGAKPQAANKPFAKVSRKKTPISS